LTDETGTKGKMIFRCEVNSYKVVTVTGVGGNDCIFDSARAEAVKRIVKKLGS
jgi:hypothetical protein